MAATDRTSPDATPAAPPSINFDLFDTKCAELGATDDTARAEIAGVNRTTLWRWRKGQWSPNLTVAARIAERLDVTVDELTGRAA
jgi:DNA-binding XRE family transcriptional regulator